MKITIDDCLSDNADSPSKFNEASGIDCSSPEPKIHKPTATGADAVKANDDFQNECQLGY